MSYIRLTEPIFDNNNKIKNVNTVYIVREHIVALKEWKGDNNGTLIVTTNGSYLVLESPSNVIEKSIRAEKASQKEKHKHEWLSEDDEVEEYNSCPFNPRCPF